MAIDVGEGLPVRSYVTPTPSCDVCKLLTMHWKKDILFLNFLGMKPKKLKKNLVS